MPPPAAPKPERQRPKRPDRQVYVPRGRRAESSTSSTSSMSPQAETVTSQETAEDLAVAISTKVTYCTEDVDTLRKDASVEQQRAVSLGRLATAVDVNGGECEVFRKCGVPPTSANSESESAVKTGSVLSQRNDVVCSDEAPLEDQPDDAAKCKGLEEVAELTQLLGASTLQLGQGDGTPEKMGFAAPEMPQCATSLDFMRVGSARTISSEDGGDKRKTTRRERNADSEHACDATVDETRDSVDAEDLKDITQTSRAIDVPEVEIDYSKFEYLTPELSLPKYRHILELYDFPAELETEDLESALSSWKGEFAIKRVDGTHALAVFSTPLAAAEALGLQTALVKMRRISEASTQSRVKAKRYREFLTPFKARPQTSASVAIRLLSGSLGVRAKAGAENKKREGDVLRDAKGKEKDVGGKA